MKKRRQIQWILFLCLASCLAGSAEAAEWKRISSPGNYYSVLMPSTPKFSKSSTESPVGRIPEELCEYKSDRLDLTAEVSLLPGIAVFFGGHSSILDKASKAYVEHVKGTVTSSKGIKSNGYLGKEIKYTATAKDGRDYRGTARFFLLKKRLYVLVGDTYLKNPDDASVTKFLDSFKPHGIIKKKPRILHPVPVH